MVRPQGLPLVLWDVPTICPGALATLLPSGIYFGNNWAFIGT